MKAEYVLFAFDSTNSAIAADRALGGMGVIVMPTLREISASCGMSLRLDPARADEASACLRKTGIADWKLYSVREDGKNVVCALIDKF